MGPKPEDQDLGLAKARSAIRPIELNIYPTGDIFNWVNMVHTSQV